MVTLLFKVLESGLSLWKTKEARKYIDEVIELKKEWYEAYEQIPMDIGRISRIERKLRLLSETFTSAVGSENSAD